MSNDHPSHVMQPHGFPPNLTGVCIHCGATSGTNTASFSCVPYPRKSDPVNHPKHYTEHPSGVECITITEHYNFCRGNALKYIWRADLKNGIEDLKKARWYLDREIARLESETTK